MSPFSFPRVMRAYQVYMAHKHILIILLVLDTVCMRAVLAGTKNIYINKEGKGRWRKNCEI